MPEILALGYFIGPREESMFLARTVYKCLLLFLDKDNLLKDYISWLPFYFPHNVLHPWDGGREQSSVAHRQQPKMVQATRFLLPYSKPSIPPLCLLDFPGHF